MPAKNSLALRTWRTDTGRHGKKSLNARKEPSGETALNSIIIADAVKEIIKEY